MGELVLWYGMFAPCGRFLGTTGFARGAPFTADDPFELMKEAVQFTDNAPISDIEREKIYHLNTEKFLALSHGGYQDLMLRWNDKKLSRKQNPIFLSIIESPSRSSYLILA